MVHAKAQRQYLRREAPVIVQLITKLKRGANEKNQDLGRGNKSGREIVLENDLSAG
jgi:hypothetical protein